MRPAIAPFLLLLACHQDPVGGKTAPVEVGTDSGPITDSTPPEDTADSGPDGPGTVTGAVTVQLTTTDELGNTVLMEWKDAYGKDFPFGRIFVAAYVVDEKTGRPDYLAQTVIIDPVPGPNPYTLEVTAPGEVAVYAALDYWGDGVIATNDPTGLHPDPVPVVSGAEATSVDVTILAPYYDFDTTGGGSGDYVLLSGDITVGGFTGGAVAALVYDANGIGPYYGSVATVNDAGAGTWAMSVYKDFGPARLLGAWDRNANDLIDPDDSWGAYTTGKDVDANPVTVGTEPIEGLDIQVPLGVSEPFGVPFVTLSGYIESNIEMSKWAAKGGVVHVAALTSPPPYDNTPFAIADAGQFDRTTWAGAALTGTVLDFELTIPSNSTAYLWAFLDADGDGSVNDLPGGEFKGTYLAPVGAISVAETSVADLFIPLLDPSSLPE